MQSPHRQKRKRKESSTQIVYENVKFSKRESTGRPGTPHRFFASSFDVNFANVTKKTPVESDRDANEHFLNTSQQSNANNGAKILLSDFVVHCHVNGLCMITIGNSINSLMGGLNKMNRKATDENIQHAQTEALVYSNVEHRSIKTQSSKQKLAITNIKFMIEISNSQTVGQKRKQAKKMKSGRYQSNSKTGKNNNDGTIQLGDVIAKIELNDGTSIDVKSCICGSVLEWNTNLINDPNLILKDPLLDGYIAVVLPNGLYPPKDNK